MARKISAARLKLISVKVVMSLVLLSALTSRGIYIQIVAVAVALVLLKFSRVHGTFFSGVGPLESLEMLSPSFNKLNFC